MLSDRSLLLAIFVCLFTCMLQESKRLVTVVGATGKQGGSVVKYRVLFLPLGDAELSAL